MMSETPLLDTLRMDPRTCAACRRLTLRQLAEEIRAPRRSVPLRSPAGTSGAGSGVVELTVALHHVFDTPRDRLVWDAGHQAYPHKILTGRRDRIRTLASGRGACPASPSAPKVNTTRSVPRTPRRRSRPGWGWPWRATCRGEPHNVVCVIGDGAMSAGMAYEAMNNAGAMNSRLIVILNDNNMSIAPPVGALSGHLARLVSGHAYRSLRAGIKQLAKPLPKFLRTARAGRSRNMRAGLSPAARCSKNSASTTSGRSMVTISTISCRCSRTCGTPRPDRSWCMSSPKRATAMRRRRRRTTSTTVWSSSTSPPASRPRRKSNAPSYTKVFGESLIKEAKKDSRIVAITAAMNNTELNQ